MNTKTEKKGIFRRVGLLALALTLVSSSMMFSTLAKYTTEVTVAGSAEVAKWAIKFTDGTTAFTDSSTVKLTDTSLNSKVTNGKIAPGTDGQFTVKVEGNGSDVGYKYSISIENMTNMPANLKFYTDDTFATEVPVIGGKIALATDVKVPLANVATAQGKTFYWKWAYEGTTLGANDVTDTADGVAAKTATFKLVINATQLDPSTTT